MNQSNQQPKRIRLFNLQGTVKRTQNTVFIEIEAQDTVLELHFGDADQLMNFFVLGIEQMAQVFPNHEASKLWNDPDFH